MPKNLKSNKTKTNLADKVMQLTYSQLEDMIQSLISKATKHLEDKIAYLTVEYDDIVRNKKKAKAVNQAAN